MVAQMSKDAIKNDPKFAKYARMVSVGVPLGAVRGKMMSDEMADADIATFMGAYTSTGTMQGECRSCPFRHCHARIFMCERRLCCVLLREQHSAWRPRRRPSLRTRSRRQ